MSIESKDCACWDEPLMTAFRLLCDELATPTQIQAAADACRANRPKIGALALVEGKLTVAQVFQILREQANSDEYFGEVAIRLGYLDAPTLCELLWLQVERSPQLVDILAERGVITYRQKSLLAQQARCRGSRLHAMAIAE